MKAYFWKLNSIKINSSNNVSGSKKPLLPWLAFAAVSIFWGTTFLSIHIGIQSFPPFVMAACRHTFAGFLIVSFFLIKGHKFPNFITLKTYSINGILMLAGGNGIISWAMQYVDSGLTALLCALTPVWIVVINKILGSKEKISKLAILGFTVCLIGQVLLFKDKMHLFQNTNYLLGIIAIVFSNMLWALGTITSKNHVSTIPSLFGAGLQMIPGGLLLFIAAFFRGELAHVNPQPDAIWALLYLIVFGSIIAYGAYMYVIKQLPASIVSTYAYINTFVAILLGWFWLHETLDTATIIAMLCTIAGVYLITKNS